MTPYDRLTVLRMLSSGKGFGFVAAALSLGEADVEHVAKTHGHPDRKKLAWAADVLQEDIDNNAVASIPRAEHGPRPHVAQPAPTPQPRPAAPAVTGPVFAKTTRSNGGVSPG